MVRDYLSSLVHDLLARIFPHSRTLGRDNSRTLGRGNDQPLGRGNDQPLGRDNFGRYDSTQKHAGRTP